MSIHHAEDTDGERTVTEMNNSSARSENRGWERERERQRKARLFAERGGGGEEGGRHSATPTIRASLAVQDHRQVAAERGNLGAAPHAPLVGRKGRMPAWRGLWTCSTTRGWWAPGGRKGGGGGVTRLRRMGHGRKGEAAATRCHGGASRRVIPRNGKPHVAFRTCRDMPHETTSHVACRITTCRAMPREMAPDRWRMPRRTPSSRVARHQRAATAVASNEAVRPNTHTHDTHDT